MPASATHPTADRLAAFIRGELPPADHAEVETHVGTCDACCSALKSRPADTLDRLARQAAAANTTEMTAVPEGPPELVDHPRYRVVRQLGAGGMGVVYLAEHRMMDRTVALKVMARKYTANPGAVERFRREVRAAAKLAHPNIVTAHDADEAGGLHFLVMEYVEGASLDRLVARRGPQPVAGAASVIRLAAQGLQHAYEKGMVHRDIKPHNLMVTRKGQVKVLDFGLARLAAETDAPAGNVGPAPDGVTSPSLVMGTPDYLAPEQARNSHGVDIRADIYALGCTLYFLLTGKPPFAHLGSAFDKMLAHTTDDPTPVRELRPEVPEELAGVLGRMMAKSPADRYSTPAEVAQALLPFTKAGAVIDAEPMAALPFAVAPPGATPAPFAFTPGPQAEVATQPIPEAGTTDPLPAARIKRKRRRKAKTGWGTKQWVAAGLALVVVAVLAATGIRAALKSIDANKAAAAGTAPTTARSQPRGGAAAPAATPSEPATPAPPAAAPTAGRAGKVVFVVPSRGLYYPDYGPVKRRLESVGVEVVTASTTLDECRTDPRGAFGSVKPDRLLEKIDPAEFDAVVFCGADVSEYVGGPFRSPGFADARRVVQHMRENGKVVAAICGGQPVLLLHDKSPGRRVARSPHVEPQKYVMARVTPVDERVVSLPEKVITAAAAEDAEPFADAIVAAIRK